MFIKQLSIFVENKVGRLAEITGILAENDVNVLALSIADTTDFGILRIIVEDHEKASEILKDNNVMVKTTDVVAISVPHTPGSLSNILKELDKLGIAIEYMYDISNRAKADECMYDISNRAKADECMIILRLSNQEESVIALKKAGINILNSDVVKNL